MTNQLTTDFIGRTNRTLIDARFVNMQLSALNTRLEQLQEQLIIAEYQLEEAEFDSSVFWGIDFTVGELREQIAFVEERIAFVQNQLEMV